ncbi:MAG: DUF2909 domain-containing protein [Rubrivivax sp.]|nr:DUF2909 domain-containing protein [Rubrivivax sp.]
MKFLIVVALVGILGALASAGAFMLRRRQPPPGAEGSAEPDRQMARALAVRVAISVGLFLFILLGWAMGWVRPGGLPVGG